MFRNILEDERVGQALNSVSDWNISEKAIEIYNSRKGQKDVFKRKILEHSYETGKGDILFAVEGVPRSTIRSLILARKFEMKGYNPVFLTHYSLNHPAYIYPQIGDVSFRDFLRKKRHISDRNLIESLGYDILEIEKRKDIETIYEDYNLDSNALACTKKHFRRYNLDLNNERIRNSYEEFKKSGKTILDNLKQITREMDIKAIIVHDPAYLNGFYGVFGAKNNINSYSISWSWSQKKCLVGSFENRNPLGQFTNRDVLEEIMAEKPSEEEIGDAEKVIEDRSKGKNLRSSHKVFSSEDSEINFSEDETVYSLFTNLLWDASLEADDVAFESPFSWLEETIEFFRENKSKKLVIKTHPAEEKRLTDEKVFDWLQENYNFNEIDNIEILSPKTDIDPYDLMSSTDVGIVYNSTTGMEMASQDIPVIVVGDTHYRGLGFTVEPGGVKEYLEELSKDPSDLKKDPRKAKKYINFLFNRKQIDFQYIKENGTEFKKIRDEDIMKDESLDLVVEKILNGEEVFYPE